MTKLSFGAHPYLLGFEQLERLVERTAKSGAEGYPPFNIEAVAENAYRITLAVAGFREEDLSITVEDRQLVVRGRQADDAGERVFLHRGIAARAFQRSFVLADGVEVAGATMEHGLLHVDLRRNVPETVVQTIRIGGKEGRPEMNTPFNGLPQGADRIVYVREVAVEDLPDEVREQMDGLEVIWSVHGADGRQLALVADRKLAFHLAREHDFTPVSVH